MLENTLKDIKNFLDIIRIAMKKKKFRFNHEIIKLHNFNSFLL